MSEQNYSIQKSKLHNPKSHAPAVYIPCWLIQVPLKSLSNNAKILYGRLAQWCDEKGDVYRSMADLAIEIGSNISTIKRTIRELKDAGLIETYLNQQGGVNHYKFYDHPWMYEPLKEQLVYKNDRRTPGSKQTHPQVYLDPAPRSKQTHINKKEIKRNKINNNGGFCKNALPALAPAAPAPSPSLAPQAARADALAAGEHGERAPKARPQKSLMLDLIAVYHEVFPNNPKHNTKVISTDLEKVLITTIKRWPEVHPEGEKLTPESFRKYLMHLRDNAPNFSLKEYKTTNGRWRKNNLVNLARFNTIVKHTEEFYS